MMTCLLYCSRGVMLPAGDAFSLQASMKGYFH